jgi:nucleotide-binding universal stress UspA family protein
MNMITACIDGSAMSASVCDAAAWLSESLEVPVKLLHVLERTNLPLNDNLSGAIGLGSREHLLSEMTRLDEERSKVALEHGKHMLEDARLRLEQQGINDIRLKQRHGQLLEALLDCEAETRVFVIGRLGEDHEPQAQAIGSHLENVVRAVKVPILVAVGTFAKPQSYMIAYDGSPTADEAIAKFANSPLLKNLPGYLVMIGTETSEHQQKIAYARQVLEQSGRSIEACLLPGNVQEELSRFRKDKGIDLMVMGAYGHSRLREFFVGSQTSKMIASSPVPLLLLR